LLRCLDCHGLQRPLFSKDNASEMARTVHRMGAHSANASPNFPFFHQNASEILSHPPTKAEADLGAYIASINLSSGETWPYKLKTQPRPTGKSTQAIITTYDLPEGAAPMTRSSTKRAMFGSPISSTNSFRKWIPRPAKSRATRFPFRARLSDGKPDAHDG